MPRKEPSYSVRLIQPFIRLVAPLRLVPPEWHAAIASLPLETRLPIPAVHQVLGVIVGLSDADIGLRAAREWGPGDGGALDYAISSANSIREAVDAAARYIALVNDALELRVETDGTDALVRFHHHVELPRAALDFELGALFRAFRSIWASGARQSLRILVTHPAPVDTSEYERTFEGATIQFSAPFSGFAFDHACLDARLSSAELRLNQVIRRHADTMLQELSSATRLAERVRVAISAELEGGDPSASHIARRLHMSPRTLERKLAREGTTFSALAEDLRRELALGYVASGRLELSDIACRLGFSHTTGFHRAFKRWTGGTPLDYRRAQRRRTERRAEPSERRAG